MSDITSYNESWLLENKDKYVYCLPKNNKTFPISHTYKHTELDFLSSITPYKFNDISVNTILTDTLDEELWQKTMSYPFQIKEINFNNNF